MTMLVVFSISGIPVRIHQSRVEIERKESGLTWTSLGSEIPQHDDGLLSLLDRLLLDGESDIILIIEDSSFSLKLQSLLSGDLRYTSSWRQVTSKNSARPKWRQSQREGDELERKTNRM